MRNRSLFHSRGSLGFRLVMAFVAVAVGAVFVLAGLTLWRTKHTVGQLAADRQQATAESIAATLALAYQQHDGWDGADPHPALMVAVQAGSSVEVFDAGGRRLALKSSMGAIATVTPPGGPQRRATILVAGASVGVAVVTFAGGELAMAETHVKDAVSGTVVIGAIIAALAAAVIAVPLAYRIVRPLREITTAVGRFGDGDTSARVGTCRGSGELKGLAATFDNMAERLESHEVARRNLTTDIAHELRTPLTLLQGNCEEIIDGISPPEIERFVQMHDDIVRLTRLVDDLGMLADADAAVTETNQRHEQCDFCSIVNRVADSLIPMLDANHHLLERDIAPLTLFGDPARLGQIVTNLLTNAIKYTPSGGHIDVGLSLSSDGNHAVLTVSDDGPGIAAVDRPHIFERFYRSDATRQIAGTGIGLAVVKQLVQAHRGTVEIPERTGGTTVVVRLPLKF